MNLNGAIAAVNMPLSLQYNRKKAVKIRKWNNLLFI